MTAILGRRVGVSGTQYGVSPIQHDWLNHMLRGIGMMELHHGGCVGSDYTAHLIGVAYFGTDYSVEDMPGWPEQPIVVHPPEIMDKVEMKCLLRDQEIVKVLPRKPYLVRNHDIVDATEALFATPQSEAEVLRSGTWATIRYAIKVGKPVNICYPSGRMELK